MWKKIVSIQKNEDVKERISFFEEEIYQIWHLVNFLITPKIIFSNEIEIHLTIIVLLKSNDYLKDISTKQKEMRII